MIDKTEFFKLVKTIEEYNLELDKWDEFGIELNDLPIGDIMGRIADMATMHAFEIKGVDWINWWIYERDSIAPYDEEVPGDLDELWNIVKKYRK